MYKFLCLFISALFLMQFSQPVFAQKKTAVAIFNLTAHGISKSEASIITTRLRSELVKTEAFNVMEREMMEEILKEQAFQLSGACDETSCLVEVGRIIAVRQIIGGSIGKIGDLYTIQLRQIDVQNGMVIKTVEEDYIGAIELLLTSVTKKVARKLAGLEVEAFAPGRGNSDLYIDSHPPGAVIYLNDTPSGKTTPATISGLPSGSYKVTLRKENFAAKKIIMLEEGEVKKEKLILKPATREIRVLTTPANAQIYLDKKYVGTTPVKFELSLTIPKAELEIKKEGYVTERLSVEFGNKMEHRLFKDLKIAGKIIVTSDPSGAKVTIDKKPVGITPLEYDQISLGKHKLEISLENYYSKDEEIELTNKVRSLKLNIPLKQKFAFLRLTGEPTEAAVFINDKKAGNLPLEKLKIKHGTHHICVKKKGFHTHRQKLSINENKPYRFTINLTPKNKYNALLYSTIIPGSGQIYAGRSKKGIVLGLATLGSSAATIIIKNDYSNKKDQYFDDKTAYATNTDPLKMNSLYNSMKNSYDEMESKHTTYQIFLGITAGLWVYNIFDSIIFFPKQNVVQLSVNSYKGNPELSLKVNF